MPLPALIASAALAAAFDHRGSACAVAAPGFGFSAASSSAAVPVVGTRWTGTLGGGVAIDDDGRELMLLARVSGRGSAVDVAALLGLRAYFRGGEERWRTFFDVQLAVPVWPVPLVGPRVAAGVQYEFHPAAGAFCAAGVQLGLGSAILIATDLSCGVQLRSYLFQ
ncbi:MAG TPA: hypothetical protein VND93_27685 [Myxococcales bacterium]|nr:hypothetical protein [Myxococcales bacterium]